MSDTSHLDDFDGTVRLFPLPNVVLFPGAALPLHIFEPRYRQMTADALAGDRRITMVRLREGWETEYLGLPAIYDVACVGEVLGSQRRPDGRYDLLLLGVARARILEEPATDKLYRVARVEVLRERVPPTEIEQTLAGLTEAVRTWVPDAAWEAGLSDKLGGAAPLSVACDLLAFHLPLPPDFKQELLEELDVARRAARLTEYLLAFAPANAKPPHPFPPKFSAN